MYENLLQQIEEAYPGKAFLTLQEVAKFLDCDEGVVYRWSKRAEVQRRPPRLMVGKSVRFPKKDFVRWLSSELLSGGEPL